MNKKLILILTSVALVSYLGTDLEVKRLPEPKVITHVIKVEDSRPPAPTSPERVLASIPIQPSTENTEIVVHDFKGTTHSGLPNGFEILDDVYAVEASRYEPSLGKRVDEKYGQVFFKTENKAQNFNKVIFDTRNKKLFLVSSVIKLEGVDESLRDKVIEKGLDEHYYNEDLQIMYVQSSQEDLIKTHEELQNLEISPKLEIIRGYHRPI